MPSRGRAHQYSVYVVELADAVWNGHRYVREFGLRLLPQLYEMYNPMPYAGACDMEIELAIGLREAGYGVWQACSVAGSW